jgi:hypothetical protein
MRRHAGVGAVAINHRLKQHLVRSTFDSCRGDPIEGRATNGLMRCNKTSAWSLSPARKADVTSYPSCQRDVLDSRSLQWAALVLSAGEHF